MADLTIGELARRSGLNASAIRYYEARELLPKSQRRGGRRNFDAATLTRLSIIELAKAFGFSLKEIGVLVAAIDSRTPPDKLWRRLAEEKLGAIHAQIANAQRLKALLMNGLICQCLTIEDCTRLVKIGGSGR